MTKSIFNILLILLSVCKLSATPEFSLWTGNKCSQCHQNEAGGGAKTNFGYTYARDASFFTANDNKFLNNLNNQLFDDFLIYGFDFRYQSSRSHKAKDAVRRYFPMQASLYLTMNPAQNLSLQGQYNLGPIIFEGQKKWSFSAKYHPKEELPSLRVGFFQPSMGLKDPDMTALDRRVAGPDGTVNLIAPDFADFGAEITYDALDWLTLQIGLFDNQTLKEVSVFGDMVPLVPDNDKTITARAVFRPEFIKNIIPEFFIGASSLNCGIFTYNNAFMGFTPYNDFMLVLKFANSNKAFARSSQSYVAALTYLVTPGLMLNVKGQYGDSEMLWDWTDKRFLMQSNVWQGSIGTKFFIMPFVELIAEYRILQCSEYKSGRWLMQLHIYY